MVIDLYNITLISTKLGTFTVICAIVSKVAHFCQKNHCCQKRIHPAVKMQNRKDLLLSPRDVQKHYYADSHIV